MAKYKFWLPIRIFTIFSSCLQKIFPKKRKIKPKKFSRNFYLLFLVYIKKDGIPSPLPQYILKNTHSEQQGRFSGKESEKALKMTTKISIKNLLSRLKIES